MQRHRRAPVSPAGEPVIIVGGGHNGLVAASYLARAGRRVIVLEARATLGGAVASSAIFPGVEARLSRFSYLVSLLPDLIIDDLGLRLELRSRRVKSYTPSGGSGLLVERPEGPRTRESFADLTGGPTEFESWMALERELASVAAIVAPTLTEPLPRADDLRRQVSDDVWTALVERPIGEPARGSVQPRRRTRDRPHRRVDRHLHHGPRPDAAAEPLLPVPRDRQRHRRVARPGRRHGSGGGGTDPSRGRGRCRTSNRCAGHRPPTAPGRWGAGDAG